MISEKGGLTTLRAAGKRRRKEPIRIGSLRTCSKKRSGTCQGIIAKSAFEWCESVRRAGTYGLVALGTAAEDVLEAIKSPTKWLRKAGIRIG